MNVCNNTIVVLQIVVFCGSVQDRISYIDNFLSNSRTILPYLELITRGSLHDIRLFISVISMCTAAGPTDTSTVRENIFQPSTLDSIARMVYKLIIENPH